MDFNADILFGIAIQLEKNGAAYYRSALTYVADPIVKKTLEDLAAYEEEHEQTFRQIRGALSGKEQFLSIYDPEGDFESYIEAFASGQVFDLQADPSAWLSASVSTMEILRHALSLEKDTIVFYLGLRDSIPESFGKERVDSILKEEMKHVAMISEIGRAHV